MATLSDIQRKIGAVKKTRQITKAMNMVAAAKLRGAQMKMESFEPYATKLPKCLEIWQVGSNLIFILCS